MQISLFSPELLTFSEIQDGGSRHLGFLGYVQNAYIKQLFQLFSFIHGGAVILA